MATGFEQLFCAQKGCRSWTWLKRNKTPKKRTVGKNKRFIQFLISMGLQHVSLSMCKIQTNKKSLSYKLPNGQKVRNLARVVKNVIRVSVVVS